MTAGCHVVVGQAGGCPGEGKACGGGKRRHRKRAAAQRAGYCGAARERLPGSRRAATAARSLCRKAWSAAASAALLAASWAWRATWRLRASLYSAWVGWVGWVG